MDEKNLIDVSSFMLFEATGDSEADANVQLAKFNEVYMDMAEDDAMSCSYDSSYDGCIHEYDKDSDHGSNCINYQFNTRNSRYNANYECDEDSDHSSNYIKRPFNARNSGDNNRYHEFRSDDEDDGVVNQAWRGDKEQRNKMVMPNKLTGVNMAHDQQQQKSNVCVEKSMKMINQREQDRLFWEACLAS